MKSWYVWVAFSKRKIAFDDNAPVDGSFRRIKSGGRSLASLPGALSLDAHLLPPVGALEVDSTPTPQDERGHNFWHVHSHAYGGSHEGLLGSPRKGHDGTLAKETYERGQHLQQVEKTHPNRFSSPPLSIRSSHT